MNEGGSFNYGRNPGWKIPSNPFENLPEDSIGRYFMYIHYICVIYVLYYLYIYIYVYVYYEYRTIQMYGSELRLG